MIFYIHIAFDHGFYIECAVRIVDILSFFQKKKRQLTVPINIVAHKADGLWEFFSGTRLTKIRITSLEEALEQDITVKEVMDLPLGYSAIRKNTGSKWIRYKT